MDSLPWRSAIITGSLCLRQGEGGRWSGRGLGRLGDPVVVEGHVSVVAVLVGPVATNAPGHQPHEDPAPVILHAVRTTAVTGTRITAHAPCVSRAQHISGESGIDGGCTLSTKLTRHVGNLHLWSEEMRINWLVLLRHRASGF